MLTRARRIPPVRAAARPSYDCSNSVAIEIIEWISTGYLTGAFLNSKPSYRHHQPLWLQFPRQVHIRGGTISRSVTARTSRASQPDDEPGRSCQRLRRPTLAELWHSSLLHEHHQRWPHRYWACGTCHCTRKKYALWLFTAEVKYSKTMVSRNPVVPLHFFTFRVFTGKEPVRYQLNHKPKSCFFHLKWVTSCGWRRRSPDMECNQKCTDEGRGQQLVARGPHVAPATFLCGPAHDFRIRYCEKSSQFWYWGEKWQTHTLSVREKSRNKYFNLKNCVNVGL
jgi:hypothetical protein